MLYFLKNYILYEDMPVSATAVFYVVVIELCVSYTMHFLVVHNEVLHFVQAYVNVDF